MIIHVHLVIKKLCVCQCLCVCRLFIHNRRVVRATRFWLPRSSTLYHSLFLYPMAGRVLQVLDHSTIYLLIAGTYTPFLLFYSDAWHGYDWKWGWFWLSFHWQFSRWMIWDDGGYMGNVEELGIEILLASSKGTHSVSSRPMQAICNPKQKKHLIINHDLD